MYIFSGASLQICDSGKKSLVKNGLGELNACEVNDSDNKIYFGEAYF